MTRPSKREPRWDLDYARGRQAELWVRSIVDGLRNGAITVEVKRDDRAAQTGRFFVEFECNGRPSGIQTTQADYWTFIVGGRAALFLLTEDVLYVARRAWADDARNRVEQRVGPHKSRGVAVPLASVAGWLAERDPLPATHPDQLRLDQAA